MTGLFLYKNILQRLHQQQLTYVIAFYGLEMVRAIVKIHALRILKSNVHIIITNCVQQLHNIKFTTTSGWFTGLYNTNGTRN